MGTEIYFEFFCAAAFRTRFSFFLSRVILSIFHCAFILFLIFLRIPIGSKDSRLNILVNEIYDTCF